MRDLIVVNGRITNAADLGELTSAWLEMIEAKMSPTRLTVEGVIYPDPATAFRDGRMKFWPRSGYTYVTVDAV